MASFVSAADAIAAAVEIERRGHAFYASVRDKAQNAEDKNFFNYMAKAELSHEKLFRSMLNRLGGLTLPTGSDEQEYLAYLRILSDSHSLFLPEQERLALVSPLGQAMRFEKDTLLFFLTLEDMVPESEKQYVRACADEEREHIRLISRRLAGEALPELTVEAEEK